MATSFPRSDVILFDGVCNLCSGFVRFVIARDPRAQFVFASLQSVAASRLLDSRRDLLGGLDTVVLLEGDRVLTRSSAGIRIISRLGCPWSLASVLLVIHRPIRDYVYDRIARNRYRWFGSSDVCMVPIPELASRFLSD